MGRWPAAFVAVMLTAAAPAQLTFVTAPTQIQAAGTANRADLGPALTTLAGGDWVTVRGGANTAVSALGPAMGFDNFRRVDEGLGLNGNGRVGDLAGLTE